MTNIVPSDAPLTLARGTGPDEWTVSIIDGRLSSSALFGKLRHIVIRHEGQDYRLSITAAGKLILTK